MKVKLKTAIAGERWSAEAGQEIELSPGEAKKLIKAGYAVEVAITGAEENAAKRTRPPTGRRKEKR